MKERAISLKECEAILLDIGGTVLLGKQPISGAMDFIKTLRRRRISHFFLSNTTSASAETLTNELQAAGFPVTSDQLLTATRSAAAYCQREGIRSLFLIGTDDQKQEIEQKGFTMTTKQPDAVLVSFDPYLDYEKLRTATHLIRNGARFIATNADTFLIGAKGLMPDTGGTIAFLSATTGQEPVVTGKPTPLMMEYVKSIIGVPLHQVAMIGDQLEIDMKVAEEYGMVSVLVLSGQTQREDVATSPYQPDYVVESVAHLIPLFR